MNNIDGSVSIDENVKIGYPEKIENAKVSIGLSQEFGVALSFIMKCLQEHISKQGIMWLSEVALQLVIMLLWVRTL